MLRILKPQNLVMAFGLCCGVLVLAYSGRGRLLAMHWPGMPRYTVQSGRSSQRPTPAACVKSVGKGNPVASQIFKFLLDRIVGANQGRRRQKQRKGSPEADERQGKAENVENVENTENAEKAEKS